MSIRETFPTLSEAWAKLVEVYEQGNDIKKIDFRSVHGSYKLIVHTVDEDTNQ
jgi:hypothetical protein